MSEAAAPSRTATAPISASLDRNLDELEAFAGPGAGLPGVPTGFMDLDELFGGLRAGHLTVIGGAPGMGCSTLALDIARAVAVHNNGPVLFISPDTDEVDINYRLLSAEAKVPLNHLRAGAMSDDDWGKLSSKIATVNAAPLLLNTTPTMTVADIEEAVEEAASEQNLRLLVVDGLQALMPQTPRESRYFEVCETVHGLKRLARTHHLAVVVTSKLNRNLEQRPDKIPMLSDLRNAGDIEDVADEVILIHRDDVFERESARPGEADFIVAKHRHGPTRWVTVAFQGHYARFVDMAR